jgi:PhzF family phenazine biosynthesis protein
MTRQAPDDVELLRYAAFTKDNTGGNPAGVVLGASGLSELRRLALAAEVGYSETAFLEQGSHDDELRIRFYSPRAEVTFCGHATIAAAVALAERCGAGNLTFETLAGRIQVRTAEKPAGFTATFTSAPTRSRPATEDEVRTALHALRWNASDLDRRYPAHVAYAGAEHLILALHDRRRLALLDYDFAELDEVMAQRHWTTLQLVHAHSPTLFSARNPFPPGGVVEDPATGGAAAAFGGYLLASGAVEPPATITLLQGEEMGRASLLSVELLADETRVEVTGAAGRISDTQS